MGFIGWIIFGAIAGWIASMIAGTNNRQGCLTNIVVGVIGAFIGGWGYSALTGGQPFDFQFWDFTSWIVAIIGAAVLLFILNALSRRAR